MTVVLSWLFAVIAQRCAMRSLRVEQNLQIPKFQPRGFICERLSVEVSQVPKSEPGAPSFCTRTNGSKRTPFSRTTKVRLGQLILCESSAVYGSWISIASSQTPRARWYIRALKFLGASMRHASGVENQ